MKTKMFYTSDEDKKHINNLNYESLLDKETPQHNNHKNKYK